MKRPDAKITKDEPNQFASPQSPQKIKRGWDPNPAPKANGQRKKWLLLDLPGNSVRDVGERMKGGAVNEDKSPENEAILINEQARRQRNQPWEIKKRFWAHDFRKEVQDPRWFAGTAYMCNRRGRRRC